MGLIITDLSWTLLISAAVKRNCEWIWKMDWSSNYLAENEQCQLYKEIFCIAEATGMSNDKERKESWDFFNS